MVVVMKQDATEADIEAVSERVRALGGEAFVSRGQVHTIVGLVGDTERFQAIDWKQLAGVDHVIRVGKPYKMVARDLHPETTTVKVGTTPVGRDTFTLIAGPCAVEDEDQTVAAVEASVAAGATILRGDVYKPRTSPYSFQGLGQQGLEILQDVRRRTGLPFVVEVVDLNQVEHVAQVADCIRIGTRNAQNFELLKEVGLSNKPVMLKRGLAMTVEEWLQAAEYVAQRGNSEIILCERGIRTFEPATRNTLDLAGMAVAQHESHLPSAWRSSASATSRWTWRGSCRGRRRSWLGRTSPITRWRRCAAAASARSTSSAGAAPLRRRSPTRRSRSWASWRRPTSSSCRTRSSSIR
jgi:3-deoxy-7-phosphoheptulonate synthase